MPAIDLDTLLDLVGSLNDSTETGSASDRFRKYLRENVTAARDVRSYVERALSQSGDQYNKALQDLVNHLGQLLEFEVTFGRYRGVRNEIGFDGLWRSPRKKQAIVVETKTTDAYTVKTAILLGYINALVSDGVISDPNSAIGLYVQGRRDTDTNQLENAIVAEGRRERLRVVSVPALVSLLELKQEYHLAHETVLDLLLPSPIKIDPIVDLIRNVVAQEQERDGGEPEPEPWQQSDSAGQSKTAPRIRRGRPRSAVADPTGKKVQAVVFDGQRVEVGTWREALEVVMAMLLRQDRQAFLNAAPTLVGKKRPYFTDSPGLLRVARPVESTNLYYEANISARDIARIANELVVRMGYDPSLLELKISE